MTRRPLHLDLIIDILDVLERHGYTRSDDRAHRPGHRLITTSPASTKAPRTTRSAPDPAAPPLADEPGPPGASKQITAAVLTRRRGQHRLAALDIAADYKRDRAATCADCPDQSCPACQSRLQRRPAYDQHGRPDAPDRRGRPGRQRHSPRRAAPRQPAPAPARRRQGGRPVTTHAPDTRTNPDPPPGRHVPSSRTRGRAKRTCAEMHDPRTAVPTTCRSPTRWPPGRPEYVIVVDQLRGWFTQHPARPSPKLLETGPPAPVNPKPDLEAEP